MDMTEMKNTYMYKPGDKVWWYGNDSKLCAGTVQQTENRPEGPVAYVDCGDDTRSMICTVPMEKCWPAKWVAWLVRNTDSLIRAMWLFFAWGIAWSGLEVLLYGEVQPRIVDDIVSVPVFIALFFMFRFKKERDLLMK